MSSGGDVLPRRYVFAEFQGSAAQIMAHFLDAVNLYVIPSHRNVVQCVPIQNAEWITNELQGTVIFRQFFSFQGI
jgi:hypothetical protein